MLFNKKFNSSVGIIIESRLIISELLGRKLYRDYFKISIIPRVLAFVIPISLYFVIGIDGIMFGLAVSYVITDWQKLYNEREKEKSTKVSDTFAMIGTIFLWLLFVLLYF